MRAGINYDVAAAKPRIRRLRGNPLLLGDEVAEKRRAIHMVALLADPKPPLHAGVGHQDNPEFFVAVQDPGFHRPQLAEAPEIPVHGNRAGPWALFRFTPAIS